jgi:hypothetical protein
MSNITGKTRRKSGVFRLFESICKILEINIYSYFFFITPEKV